MEAKHLGVIILALSLGLMGCAKEKGASDDNDSDTGRFTTPRTDADSDDGYAFKIVSKSVMSKYTQRPLSNPRNVKIHFEMEDHGGGQYGGSIRITYKDNNYDYEGMFDGGDDSSEARYNKWFIWQGSNVYHGFYDDPWGAIIVVFDQVVNHGDGDMLNGRGSGSVYFKNFEYHGPITGPLPDKHCWFVTIGPYDCRTFFYTSKDEGKIDTTHALYPENGYAKLGSFENVPLKAAFGWE